MGIRYPGGRESTVAIKDLAPAGEGLGSKSDNPIELGQPVTVDSVPPTNDSDLNSHDHTSQELGESVIDVDNNPNVIVEPVQVRRVEPVQVRRSSRSTQGVPPDRLNLS